MKKFKPIVININIWFIRIGIRIDWTKVVCCYVSLPGIACNRLIPSHSDSSSTSSSIVRSAIEFSFKCIRIAAKDQCSERTYSRSHTTDIAMEVPAKSILTSTSRAPGVEQKPKFSLRPRTSPAVCVYAFGSHYHQMHTMHGIPVW